ncbi:Ion transport protein [Desulfurispirillum indicum S5]|uniref:Ion transport protein n=1 Tax=Desulfurispirillum indicum (strain ATCC BAA-1389 / DSM 22839 / S5) TaxID=653733 RepID=E6W5I2_DESIS|nr:ion transporter [Desulfurispirillum indicum]ADU64913.1 Ion transport protein [Desulfurispirillum indicum S5]
MGMIQHIVQHQRFQQIVIGLIFTNAVIIGMETYPALYDPNPQLFFWLEQAFLWAFTVEIALRMVAAGSPVRFFKSGWNLFDFVIVASGHLFVGGYFISVLRILRVLRVLRAITVIPSLQRMVAALLRTIPAIGNIMILLSILFYLFAVIGTILYRDELPEYFGSLHTTLLTLFQIVTLESWASGVMRPLMEQAPYAWIYFVVFILSGTFIIVNLFIGVIVTNVQEVATICEKTGEPRPTAQDIRLAEVHSEVQQLRQEMRELATELREKAHRK